MNITLKPKGLEMNVRINGRSTTRIRSIWDPVKVSFSNNDVLIVEMSLEQAKEIAEMVYEMERKEEA